SQGDRDRTAAACHNKRVGARPLQPREASMSSDVQDLPVSIAVFSPTPLLTVTIEAKPDDRPELHIHAGGQGFWMARMVARLGVPVTLCAPIGGDTGRLIKTRITDEEVRLCPVEIAGANGSYVHDRRSGQRVEIC